MSYVGIKTKYHAEAVLNTARGTNLTAWTPYVGLLVAAGDPFNGVWTEIDYDFDPYARQSVTFGAPVDGVMVNTNHIYFPDYPGPDDPDVVVAFGIFDAVTAGNLRYAIPLTIPFSMYYGSPQIAAGLIGIREQ